MKGFYLLLLAVTTTTASIIRPIVNARSCPRHSGCPEQDSPDYTVHLPYAGDCHKFYKCSSGHGCEMECPYSQDGEVHLVFNPDLQVCDWPENVPNADCRDTTTTSTTTEQQPSSSTTEQTTSTTTEQPPSSSTTEQTTSTTTEQPPSSSTTEQTTSTTTEQPPSSSTTEQTTSTTTEQPPSSSTTEQTTSTTTEQPPSSSTTEQTTSTSTEPSATPTSEGPKSTSEENTIPYPPGQCPSTGRARVSHETDCNAYYQCRHGKRSGPYYCSQGHVFNPYTEACDVEANVDCNKIING